MSRKVYTLHVPKRLMGWLTTPCRTGTAHELTGEIPSLVPGTQQTPNKCFSQALEKMMSLGVKRKESSTSSASSSSNHFNSLNLIFFINIGCIFYLHGCQKDPTEKRASPWSMLFHPSLTGERYCLRWEKCSSQKLSNLSQWKAGIWTSVCCQTPLSFPLRHCLYWPCNPSENLSLAMSRAMTYPGDSF